MNNVKVQLTGSALVILIIMNVGYKKYLEKFIQFTQLVCNFSNTLSNFLLQILLRHKSSLSFISLGIDSFIDSEI